MNAFVVRFCCILLLRFSGLHLRKRAYKSASKVNSRTDRRAHNQAVHKVAIVSFVSFVSFVPSVPSKGMSVFEKACGNRLLQPLQ